MKTNRLSKRLAAGLNVLMTKEAYASQIYLSYAEWANNQGFGGIANYLFRHAQEERNLMMKILEYMLKRGSKGHISTIPDPLENPVSLNSCVEKIFEQEADNKKAVHILLNMILAEEDRATWNFVQWFLKAQIKRKWLL